MDPKKEVAERLEVGYEIPKMSGKVWDIWYAFLTELLVLDAMRRKEGDGPEKGSRQMS